MIVLPLASILAFLLELGFSAAMLLVGAALGWWLRHMRSTTIAEPDFDAERAREAVSRIRELARTVADDVDEHSNRVQAMSDDLNEAASNNEDSLDQIVLQTVAQIVESNEKLQTQLSSAQQRLKQQAEEIELHAADARTDALTKLSNRRAFDYEMERRHAEWQRLSTPFSLLLIDVDHFKRFNDVHGHQAGDEVLRGVAKVLKQSMRDMDLVCRYGGEEFGVVMPVTDTTQAKQAANRARRAIERASFRFDGKELKVTASVGLAEIAASETCDMLIRRADEALYASKQAGRNCSHYHDGEANQLIGEKPAASEKNAKRKEKKHSKVDLENLPESPPCAVLDKLSSQEIFADEVHRRVAEAHRFGVPLSAMIVGIDNLQQIFEKVGPAAGKLFLDTVAGFLQSQLREMDLLARYHNGQFSVMLPGSIADDAVRVCGRARAALASCSLPLGDDQLKLTLSFGLAEASETDTSAGLVKRAEAAFAAATASGGDAIYIQDGDVCVESEFVATAEQA